MKSQLSDFVEQDKRMVKKEVHYLKERLTNENAVAPNARRLNIPAMEKTIAWREVRKQ